MTPTVTDAVRPAHVPPLPRLTPPRPDPTRIKSLMAGSSFHAQFLCGSGRKSPQIQVVQERNARAAPRIWTWMMPTDNEIQRLAAMANALRPEWPIRSLVTHLINNHAHRTYRDAAVALAWIATDPATSTPARLGESGPWWDASNVTRSAKLVVKSHRCIHHPAHPASHCTDCIAEAVPKPSWFPSFKRDVAAMFAMPPDVAPTPPKPAETCGICHAADTQPGRGICDSCDTKTRATT